MCRKLHTRTQTCSLHTRLLDLFQIPFTCKSTLSYQRVITVFHLSTLSAYHRTAFPFLGSPQSITDHSRWFITRSCLIIEQSFSRSDCFRSCYRYSLYFYFICPFYAFATSHWSSLRRIWSFLLFLTFHLLSSFLYNRKAVFLRPCGAVLYESCHPWHVSLCFNTAPSTRPPALCDLCSRPETKPKQHQPLTNLAKTYSLSLFFSPHRAVLLRPTLCIFVFAHHVCPLCFVHNELITS